MNNTTYVSSKPIRQKTILLFNTLVLVHVLTVCFFTQGSGTHDVWLSLQGADSGETTEGSRALWLPAVFFPNSLYGGR